ncbi:UNVERIFIED_CONTAM: putative late blight resistance proteinR1B-8 [Sesamum radiatum]|uniref:Late blight resistance proteinR1B-8 n=1 Tax=Sesamum radiatum TaxID=300843 RepID=A0AAW2PMW7_SESRA
MAVAAYAALLSLTHVLDNIQHPVRGHRLHEKPRNRRSGKAIAVVAVEADDVIDLHVVDQLREGSQDESPHLVALSSFCQDIDKVIEKIDSIMKELRMVKLETSSDEQESSDVSYKFITSVENIVVGCDEQLEIIMAKLMRNESDLHILPIVGMGGLGKTTLAKLAFNHQSIVNHFDVRIWLTISEEYNARKILLGLLNDGKVQESSETFAELGDRLYKRLSGEKYLIVMDDLWSTKFWDDLKLFFPNNRNGSRIMVTTRLSDVVVSLGSKDSAYQMRFLPEQESWGLLCTNVFPQFDCPPELEAVGRSIAKSCRGHPLVILVISGLLRRGFVRSSNMTINSWKSIGRILDSVDRLNYDEAVLEILSLGYNYLPISIKPCFLYMGVFPEDHDIDVSELIKLWVGEGFIRPIGGKTLEEVANDNLEELAARKLILIHKRTGNGQFKVCSIHDLLRDLCLRESKKEQFFCVPKVQRINLLRGMGKMCLLCSDRFSLQEGMDVQVLDSLRSASVASGLVCKTCKNMYPDLTRLRLIKVFGQCCHEQHTKLRYINIRAPYFLETNAHCEVDFVSPATVHLLWNLQTLSIHSGTRLDPMVLPSKIWEMPQLRHIMVKLATLPDLSNTQDATILENLQTLSFIQNLRCTLKILEKIPNLKKLKDLLTGRIAFPRSLKKLTLSGCKLPWEDMKFIGFTLHNLEVLKLYNNAFKGPEWNPVEGQFRQLKVLSIWFSDLVWWRAKAVHFPDLKCLVLGYMTELGEIPSAFGEIRTLRSIHLNDCSDSVVNSAKQILEDQQNRRNEDFQVHVDED